MPQYRLAILVHYGYLKHSLVPIPPFNTARGKGGSGEYSTLLLTSTEFQSDWLMWQLSHL